MSLHCVDCKGCNCDQDGRRPKQGGLYNLYVGLLANLDELQVAQGEYALLKGLLPGIKLDGFDACNIDEQMYSSSDAGEVVSNVSNTQLFSSISLR